jgi:hypothetical protein
MAAAICRSKTLNLIKRYLALSRFQRNPAACATAFIIVLAAAHRCRPVLF